MARSLDWNDIRVFLAVADTGSTLQASRELGVSQSTVSRRVAAMEDVLRLRLFEKRRTGYALSESGRDLLETARATAKAMIAFEMQAAAQKRGSTGTVRLTASDAFSDYLLDRAVAEFRLEFPSIQIEIVSSAKRLDLANGDADIALRAGPRPHEPDLVGRRIAEDTWSLYCSQAYANEHGVPRTPADLAAHRVIGVAAGNPASSLGTWLERNVPESAIFMRRSSIEGILSSIANSTGVSLMSDFLAGADPRLVRCFSPDLGPVAEIWLLTHERLRDVPRVRAVLDFLHGYFAEGKHIGKARGRD